MLRALVALSVLSITPAALGALYSDPSQLPASKKYDYIVVGAGTAGGVLGRRLSEDSTKNVLVIEAGQNPDGNINAEVPFLASNTWSTSLDWNFTTTPQPGLGGRSVKYPRGKALGGSSTINLLVYNRGTSEDYNRWASLTGDIGWSWKALWSYMLKVEHPAAAPDGHNINTQWVAADHGTNGPLGLTIDPYSVPTDSIITNVTQQYPSTFPYNQDFSGGYELGIGWLPVTQENGARASSWTHYLKPVLSRPNLDILTGTQVLKVVQTGSLFGVPIFRGVQVATGPSAPVSVLNATREIILSAGAVQSPQLLMLSGIGPKQTLSGLGINTIVNNNNVGAYLQDHPLLTNTYNVVSTVPTLDIYKQNSSARAQALAQWQATHDGPLTLSGPNQLGFFRNPPYTSSIVDPAAGPNTAHYQMGFTDTFMSLTTPIPPTGNFFTVITNIVSPSSFGNVTITSSSPWDAPLINPALIASDYDLFTMRNAVKNAYNFTQTAPMQNNFIVSPWGTLATALAAGTDAAIDSYIQQSATTVWHPTSSTRMTHYGGTDGVLDPALRVIGTIGLRVADAGAFPRIPAANTQAAVYILAERAADIIKRAAIFTATANTVGGTQDSQGN